MLKFDFLIGVGISASVAARQDVCSRSLPVVQPLTCLVDYGAFLARTPQICQCWPHFFSYVTPRCREHPLQFERETCEAACQWLEGFTETNPIGR
ncbi:hypothetical protein ARMSODRAFT_967267 [Armillaria solidipes]|uniref:Uncharacterized protein n=1 Tax=Armillaria solidipes TaxID=1076256 RepID=A0A2H3AQJ0_9AGAR|nr:hypothetical protein ARMSODRAFT_967267 [Armillaria solidipes]